MSYYWPYSTGAEHRSRKRLKRENDSICLCHFAPRSIVSVPVFFFPVGVATQRIFFRLIQSVPASMNEQRNILPAQENGHLSLRKVGEAFSRFYAKEVNWNEVSESIGTKTPAECKRKFLEMVNEAIKFEYDE